MLKDYLFSSRLGPGSATKSGADDTEMDVGPDEKGSSKKAEGVPMLESAIQNAAGVETSINGTVPTWRAEAVVEPVPMSTSTEVPAGGTDTPMVIS